MPDPDPVPETDKSYFPLPPPIVENEHFGIRPPSNINLEDHEARTGRFIAIALVIVLVVSIVSQYVALIILTIYHREDAVPSFEHLFNASFPVLAGLVGSAVTYYLTKKGK